MVTGDGELTEDKMKEKELASTGQGLGNDFSIAYDRR